MTAAMLPSQAPFILPPVPVPLLVLDPSVHQTRPPLISGLKMLFHSHIPGTLTVACLWST